MFDTKILNFKEIEKEDIQFINKKYITTGFNNLDKKLFLSKGELVLVASKASIGKTSFITQLCNNQIENNLKVGLYSLDHTKDNIVIKLLAQKCNIPLYNLMEGDHLNQNDLNKLTNAYNSIKNHIVIDSTNYTLKDLIAKIKNDSTSNNLDVVYIDYFQLIKPSLTIENRDMELNEIIKELKILAKDLNILIVATSPINKDLDHREDKRPRLSDLDQLETIEDDANKIILLHRDDIYKEKEEDLKEKEAFIKGEQYISKYINKPIVDMELIIVKNDTGLNDTVKLNFIRNYVSFTDKEAIKPIMIKINNEEAK